MVIDSSRVDGHSAIVTGGSVGIGKAIAARFASVGADVLICSREQDRIEAAADEICSENPPGDVLPIECDVTDRTQVRDMTDRALDEWGHVDVLVNNAGASFMAPFEDISENGWNTVLNINLNGTFHCTQEVGEAMRAGDGGVIINLSSIAGITGAPQMAHYGAAKAGIINFTRTIAYEWADDDVRVNCVAPGIIVTKGLQRQMGVSPADTIERRSVKRRMGRTDELVDVVQFLASPASSYIVGETIRVQGVPRVEEKHEVEKPHSWLE